MYYAIIGTGFIFLTETDCGIRRVRKSKKNFKKRSGSFFILSGYEQVPRQEAGVKRLSRFARWPE